jgi:hypothetical protein
LAVRKVSRLAAKRAANWGTLWAELRAVRKDPWWAAQRVAPKAANSAVRWALRKAAMRVALMAAY